MFLKTERLRVVRPAKRHVDEITRLARNPKVNRWMLFPRPYYRQHAEDFIRFARREDHRGTGQHRIVVRAGEGTVLGAVGLNGINTRHRRAELGYWLGVPYWGYGYATEACLAVVDYAFRRLRLHRLIAITLVENRASEGLLQKLGFEKEGRLRRDVKTGGRWRDLHTWGLLREDW